MTTPEGLRRRAERAAAAIIAQHDLAALGISHDVLVPVLAVGWLEGWGAGGEDAKAVVQEVFAGYTRAGLHSVKVTP